MPDEIVFQESETAELDLTEIQAQVLSELGTTLAARKKWWGDSGEANPERSVIEVRPQRPGRFTVLFREVVGVVSLGDLQLRVKAKIPRAHFNFLVEHGQLAPRLAPQEINVERAEELGVLIARWCVGASESLLRLGLRVGYRETDQELGYVRGSLNVLPTAIAVSAGRPIAYCTYEELDEDIDLNRLIKAACRAVSADSSNPVELRRRARRIVMRMENVGVLTPRDRSVKVDRLTGHYEKSVVLAKLVLENAGIQTRIGACTGTAFLMRTPELIEDALRSILSAAFPHLKVEKRRLTLGDSRISLNPDLVFMNSHAIGDVKYRFIERDWDRNSLYQIVTFATGFESRKCAIFGFLRRGNQEIPRELQIGSIQARVFGWKTGEGISPEESAEELIEGVRIWISA